ncbi:unnamed protein product, partial [Prorocentrum cordatum]
SHFGPSCQSSRRTVRERAPAPRVTAPMDMYQQEESIYNIVPPPPQIREKPPKHVSKHDPKLPPTASTFNTKGSTVGMTSNISGESTAKSVPDRGGRNFGKPPGACVPDPQKRLQANAANKVPTLSEVRKNNPDLLQPSQLKPKIRPDVPKSGDAPVMNLVSSKNFIVANAVETILAAPKKGSDGARDYLSKQDFGKTPKYLSRVRADIDDEKSYIANLMQQQQEEEAQRVRPMSEDERQSLISGLKANWETVNKDYQAMAHLTKLDTVGKIRRKEQMETKLTQIEKDIEKLSKKSIIIHSEF